MRCLNRWLRRPAVKAALAGGRGKLRACGTARTTGRSRSHYQPEAVAAGGTRSGRSGAHGKYKIWGCLRTREEKKVSYTRQRERREKQGRDRAPKLALLQEERSKKN